MKRVLCLFSGKWDWIKEEYFSVQMQKAMQQKLCRLSSNAYRFWCFVIMQIFLSCSYTMIEQELGNTKIECLLPILILFPHSYEIPQEWSIIPFLSDLSPIIALTCPSHRALVESWPWHVKIHTTPPVQKSCNLSTPYQLFCCLFHSHVVDAKTKQ